MKIYKVNDKRIYLSLLLLADEQECMIERYIDKGEMYVLDDDGIKAEIVVCDEGMEFLKLKILLSSHIQATIYGKKLVEFVCKHYKEKHHTIRVGTGNSPLPISFYQKCGFKRSEVIKDFFYRKL